MYTNDSEISGHVSIGNHLGHATMFSNKVIKKDNLSLSDINHGMMLIFATNADVSGNIERGTADHCQHFSP
jgi:nitrous oxidase accessory protein